MPGLNQYGRMTYQIPDDEPITVIAPVLIRVVDFDEYTALRVGKSCQCTLLMERDGGGADDS
jgi:hypothetical protein